MAFIRKNNTLSEKNSLFQKEEIEKKYNLLNETVKYGQQLAKIGCWLYEVQTSDVFWSDEVYNILGCTAKDLNNKLESILAYVHPDDLESVKEATYSVYNLNEYDIEFRIVAQNGQVKHLHEKTKVILDENDNKTKMVGIIQDITEKKLREISLMEIGEDFNRAQRVAGVGSWKYDVVKDKFYGTDETFNIYGVNRSEFNNDYRNAIKLIHPDYQDKVQKAIKKLMSGQSASIEFWITQKDGTDKYVATNAEPIFNTEGCVVGVIGTMQDITEKNFLMKI
jgi:PAS domain S-box-containing protein